MQWMVQREGSKKTMNYRSYTTMMMSGAVATTLLFSQIAPASAQANRTYTLESGTVIPVKLRETLSSAEAHKGDRFTATLQSDDAARSLNLPLGTSIEGTVSSVRPMRDKEPGVIALTFNRIILPNESTYPIQGSLIGLDNKSVTRSSNGRLVAKPDQKNKTLLYAGYGAAGGLLLGALTKGNTILDTLIGGGLGYLLGSQDKNHGDPRDVTLKPNTEMGVRLDRSVRITGYDDSRNNDGSNLDRSSRDRTDRNGDPVGVNRDRNGDPTGVNRDRSGDPNGVNRDRNRDLDRNQNRDQDVYDTDTRNNRVTTGLDSYQVLKQYTDVRDNGRPIRVMVDGTRVSFVSSARPFVSNGVVMVPAVPVLKAARVHYSYTGSEFTADGPGEPLTVRVDSRTATGSGTHRFQLPATVQRRNGALYVPMQFLAVVTGQKLTFDRETQTMELGATQYSSLNR
jgi:hypothetical protein